MGTVTVVVPCRDAGATLAQTLGSVLEQTRPPHEVLVVDDGSTDETPAIARRFAEFAPGVVRVITHDVGNAPRSRNLGASEATGERLLFLDADDVLAPGTLAALDAGLDGNPRGVAICPWYRLERQNGFWIERPASCRARRWWRSPLEAWLRGWYHPPCSVLWSRTAFQRTGGWDENCRSNQDGDLMMRALAIGIPLTQVGSGASYYRRAPVGRSSLADARYSAAGLRSRFHVVVRLAELLHGQGRLRRHAGALSYSLSVIADDAAEAHPQVSVEAERIARILTPVRMRARRGAAGRIGRAIYHRTRKAGRLAQSLTGGATPPPREVDAGTRTATGVNAGTSSGLGIH